ncbi:peptide ABC transporter ATP-binding protein [Alsobacter soli]|uniref:Peptide ABC transporter ATP-binding protein n=1 Tax=Alsobacter soli TaxID=2109933 RepID=A0A2T1HNF1_9HYPH|nr:ABC transporter ATP-binding protein [Alsobacter soli]PSC03185.1 peptide ABC transporter ATP-binding protein [Alsobacter soli]
MSASSPLLEVMNLRTSFAVGDRRVKAVRGVSFAIADEEVLGLIGESGSGKTVTGMSLLRLLPEHAAVEADAIRFRGKELSGLGDDDFRALRGVQLAMIFQDPVGSFNPAKTIGWHLQHAIERRSEADAKSWRSEAESLLLDVGIRAPERVLSSYPHQLSGGMLQRALIAMIIALRPALIIADEPTTNLDNLVERQILDLIRLHQRRLKASVLFVTHDLAIAEDICDRIAVMYAGEIVEIGPAEDVLRRPKHPYAACLLQTSLSLEQRDEFLFELAGEPGGRIPEEGCAFAGRCPKTMPQCRTIHPEMRAVGPGHQARCLLHGD